MIEALFIAAWVGFSGWAIVHALLHRDDPYAAWAWITLTAAVPFGGAAWYWLFGINRVHTRRRGPRPRHQRRGFDKPGAEQTDDKPASSAAHPAVPAAFSEVARTGDTLTRRPLLDGNRLELLYNGEQAYPRMLAAIDAATRWIALEMYIFDTDAAGQPFIEALARAKDRGVEIRCLLDGVGESGLFRAWKRAGSELLERGLKVERFNPMRFWPPFLHINLRNHRKLLLVDGVVGFAGGMNLSAVHLAADTSNPARATDVQIECCGPVLDQLLDMFCEDWRYASGEDWQTPADSSADAPQDAAAEMVDKAACRLITDGPNEDLGQLSLILLAAIANAQKRIFIVTPYFLPPTELRIALQSAAIRGVEVDVILPRVNDQRITHYAARNNFAALLKRGVRIHYQPAPFCHAKLFVVDDTYAQFGSANFDPRSLQLNFELMIEVYNKSFAGDLAQHCESLREKSDSISDQRVKLRTLPAKLRDAVCWLFSPYL